MRRENISRFWILLCLSSGNISVNIRSTNTSKLRLLESRASWPGSVLCPEDLFSLPHRFVLRRSHYYLALDIYCKEVYQIIFWDIKLICICAWENFPGGAIVFILLWLRKVLGTKEQLYFHFIFHLQGFPHFHRLYLGA